MTTRFLCVFLLSVNLSYGQGYDTSGDEEFIKNIPKKTQTQGFVTAAYPESYDLTKYMPPIGDQGRSGSCVAWTLSLLLYVNALQQAFWCFRQNRQNGAGF